MNIEVAFRYSRILADLVVAPLAHVSGNSILGVRDTVDYRSMVSLVDSLAPERTHSLIRELIDSPEPKLIGRFGSTEMRVLLKFVARQKRTPIEKLYALVARMELPFWSEGEHQNLRVKSGFYPITEDAVASFVDELIAAIREVDLLGSWVPGENKLRFLFPEATIAELNSLSPFATSRPWTEALEGKRVVVVHPFKSTIEAQFSRREELFDNPRILPDFDLFVIKAVQSLGTPPSAFPTWFDGLDYMHNETKKHDFDVALVACGSYGMPLGARIKSDGKKAIVLGGALQLLFGIKGRRWDSDDIYNSSWVRPAEDEKPDGFLGADGGAYW